MVRRVLIIDDEVDLCMLISNFLSKRNYDVTCAYTMADGFKKLDAVHPDILLLDNNLPDGLGWNEAGKIHNKYPDMRITLLSAYEASMYSITSNGMDFTRLEKPISLSTIENYL
jgi:DNA-binding response OmpR family regulator